VFWLIFHAQVEFVCLILALVDKLDCAIEFKYQFVWICNC